MEIAFFRPLLSSPSQGEERVDVDLKYLKKPPSHDSGEGTREGAIQSL